MRAVVCLLSFVALGACGGGPASLDGGGPDPMPEPSDGGALLDGGVEADAGRPDSGSLDAGRADAGPDGGAADAGRSDGGARLVTVSHPRELRGVWVATVSNLDLPQLTSRDAGLAAMTALVERTRDAGLNAIFFQVRPESDAWYQSSLEPWSRFVTGAQGRDPGWDPLETLLDLAHPRGLEVHAWVNPYRGLVSASAQTASNHVSRTLSAHAITYDGKVTMNPGALPVRAHVVSVMRDLLDRYDVDGLHFDDYFYPYPDGSGAPFPDEATFQAFRADAGLLPDGGTWTKSEWRRDNVNQLVREVMAVVTAEHPQVRFGISPFGIWRPNNPPGVVGLDAYETISCDAVTWMNQGWVDYVAPQLYWPTTSSGQPFVPLLSWWANGTRGGRHVFAGHGLYRLGMPGWTSVDEIRAQVNATRTLSAQGVLGGIHFREANLRTNLLGVTDLFRRDLYASPALPPPLPRQGASLAPLPPTVTRTGATVTASHPLPMTVRFYGLYRLSPQGPWQLVDVAGGPQAVFTASPGTWAVSAVGRGGAESQGAVVVVP
ncbi:MAG: family 10 glycosylhydrolase [Myxococcaceae bacterium]|nr:family 10 glycosylhydrolase [Myxococcaceae bacterium]